MVKVIILEECHTALFMIFIMNYIHLQTLTPNGDICAIPTFSIRFFAYIWMDLVINRILTVSIKIKSTHKNNCVHYSIQSHAYMVISDINGTNIYIYIYMSSSNNTNRVQLSEFVFVVVIFAHGCIAILIFLT